MGNNNRFVHLFRPGRMGKIEMRNRVVMPAMAGFTSSIDGLVTDLTRDFYEARAKGGGDSSSSARALWTIRWGSAGSPN